MFMITLVQQTNNSFVTFCFRNYSTIFMIKCCKKVIFERQQIKKSARGLKVTKLVFIFNMFAAM
jgi:hypothetical protein